LAEVGLAGSPVPFEGNRGFLKAFSARPNPEALVDGLGERWDVPGDSFKPYAFRVVTHPIIDAMRRLRPQGVRPRWKPSGSRFTCTS
jgi:2-methylcitrate dehydratase PrpD